MIWSCPKPSRRGTWTLLLLTPLLSSGLKAQQGLEYGLHALSTAAAADFLGAGAQVALRPGGRARFVATITPGALDGDFAIRGEVLGQFLLNPRSPRRGVYAGGGLAGISSTETQGYVVLLIGIESHPGGRSGWMLEAGIGGGVRVMAGYRWRRLKR